MIADSVVGLIVAHTRSGLAATIWDTTADWSGFGLSADGGVT